MKKALIVILAVAILGTIGFFVNKNDSGDSTSDHIASSSNSGANNATASASAQTQSAVSDQNTTYRDGSYTKSADTPYGQVKITVVISGSRISDVVFDDMPNDEDRSTQITADSSPKLRQNAIKAQSADIDFVSGATSTSFGFQESLQAALDAAKVS